MKQSPGVFNILVTRTVSQIIIVLEGNDSVRMEL